MTNDQEITMKNTKAEILEALNAALARAEAAESGKLNPVKVEKEKTEKKAVESAKASVEKNIFSAELLGKFNDLQVAIAAEEARLQELYGVSAQLQKLALVIEAGRERQLQIDSESDTKAEEARVSIEKLRGDYSRMKLELQEEYDAISKKLKVERAREAEEFQYNLKREREKDNNDWESEKDARETALAKKEEQAQAILAEASEKAEYIKSLEEKVGGIAALIEAEKKVAKDAAIAELTREYEHKAALSNKDNESIQARQNDKIVYLEKELEAANKANLTLQDKLDKAYAELRELAVKTVESASGVRIIGGSGE